MYEFGYFQNIHCPKTFQVIYSFPMFRNFWGYLRITQFFSIQLCIVFLSIMVSFERTLISKTCSLFCLIFLQAIYDYQPQENDTQQMLAWLTVMQEAHLSLCLLDKRLCLSHLPRLFTVCVNGLASMKVEICNGCTSVMKVRFVSKILFFARWISTSWS